MSFKRKLALNISIIRTSNNLTQSEFANKIGVSPSIVSKMENAIHVPSAEIIRTICNTFDVDANWLMDLNSNTVLQQELIDTFFKLSMDQQQALLTLIRTIPK